MTRGDFVAELLSLWEQSVKKLKEEKRKKAAEQIQIAIGVLELTYTGEQLLDNDSTS